MEISCDFLRQFALASFWAKLVVTTYDSWSWRRFEGRLLWPQVYDSWPWRRFEGIKLVVTAYDSLHWRRVEGSLVWLLTTIFLIVVIRTVIFAITHQESRNAFGAPVAQVVSLFALTSGTFNDTGSFTKLQFDGFGRLRVYWRDKKASMYTCSFKHKN